MWRDVRRPIPRADALSAAFWDACRDARLVVQGCPGCGHLQFPFQWLCEGCGAEGGEPVTVSGLARLASWTLTHNPFSNPFADALPYWVLCVELVEANGLYLLSDAPGEELDAGSLWVGRPMRVVFVQLGEERLPQFRFAPAASEGA